MKRCDLHIHTVPSLSDRAFTYDKEVLIDYATKTRLDVIAITNHNLFDFHQFVDIKNSLPNVVVLPGIEVDLEKGHILAHLQSSVFKLSKDLIDSIHEEGIVAYTS